MKKHIVTLAGGLGNQMLQFALYIHLKSINYNCELYLKPDKLNDHHDYNIDALFHIEKITNNNEILNWYLVQFEFFMKVINYLNKRFKTHKFNIIENLLPLKIINFPTWNNYTFLNQFKSNLDGIYIFPDLVSDKNINLKELITKNNSVSIHIRRGDYIKNIKWRSILGDICDLDYYQSAISKISELIESPIFIIFSDDTEWAKKNLRLVDAIYVDWNNGKQSYIDLQLMSLCKHNIIANSTFSLMAAWLNENLNKKVISPSKWRNYYKDTTVKKFIPTQWIIINNDKPNVSIVVNGAINMSDVKNILRQSYSDFELIIDDDYSEIIFDERVKLKSKNNAKGNHIFNFNSSEIQYFFNRQYLSLRLINHLEKLNTEPTK